jgi:anti-sigma regulatory factor (Ser/Thr protein kinase)
VTAQAEPVSTLVDVRAVAAMARRWALSCGLTRIQAEHLALVVAELGANAVIHGHGGVVTVCVSRAGWKVEAVDRGPGFSEAVLTDGGRSNALGRHGVRPAAERARSFGSGLASVRRLSTHVSLQNMNPGAFVAAAAELSALR